MSCRQYSREYGMERRNCLSGNCYPKSLLQRSDIRANWGDERGAEDEIDLVECKWTEGRSGAGFP